MKRFLFFLLILFPGLYSFSQPVKVMLITGGHAYDTVQFFEMFDSLEGIVYKHFQQPEANEELVKNQAKDFDVLVFYDMWQKISADQKSAYMRLAEKGKPFLFLHHSIASYQSWTEFEKLVGGKYFEEAKNVPEELWSTYDHDVWVYANVENYTPVTVGFKQVRFFDEVYGNVRISEDVIPLLRTRHPKSMEFIAWQHKYKASDVVYVQPGHDYRTYESEDYRKLLKQAIFFLAKRKTKSF